MAKYWYQRIANPDAVTTAATAPISDKPLKFITASRASGLFKDEPEVLQAFVNADVPFAVANRSMAEIANKKAEQFGNLFGQAGYSKNSMDQGQIGAIQNAQTLAQGPPDQPKSAPIKPVGLTANIALEFAKGQKETGFWNSLAGIASGVVGAGKHAVGALGEGLTKIASPIMAPLAAGSAQKGSTAETVIDVVGKELSKTAGGNPGAVGAAILGSVFDYGKGVAAVTGASNIDPNQRTDMQRAGYDPNSAASRYAYYYQEFNGHRKPVAENDIAILKNQFNPGKVDIARELVTSGYFDDPVKGLGGLSPEAQNFARNLSTQKADSEDGKLVKAMQDNASLSFGGHLMNLTPGADLGGTKRAWGSALSDLVAFWYIDPLVGASIGAKAVKYGLRGVPANKIEDVTSMLAASDDLFKPKGFNATRFDDTLRTVDKVYNLQQEGRIAEAASETEKFQRLSPDAMGIFDTLSAMRSGAITRVRPREGVEQLREATAADKANRPQQPFLFDSAEIGKEKPMWKLSDAADEAVSAETSAKAREQLANDLGAFVWYEAVTSGRPLYQGKMLLPGQIAVNARFRQAFASVRDLYSRQDGKFARFLDETAKARQSVDLDGDVLASPTGVQQILTDSHAADWVKENYTGTIASPTLGIAKSFGKAWKYFENSFSNKTINFDSPESTELFRRWVVQFLPKRHSYALVNEFAQANPAARYGLFQQTVQASLNAAGIRNTPAASRVVDQMLKGIAPKEEVFGRVGGPMEMYTDPINNTIKIGDSDVAAGVHTYQLSEGVQLPNLRELKRVLNRNSVLGYAAGSMNNAVSDMVTRAWKVSKVANPANMARQALELFAFTAARSPEAMGGYAQARYLLKAQKGEMKADKNDLKRMAADLENVDQPTLAKLDEAYRTGDSTTYSGIIRDALNSKGIQGRAADVLTRAGETVDIRGMVPNGLSKTALAMAAPLDWLRRTRALAAEKLDLKDTFSSPFTKELDDIASHQYLQHSLNNLGAAADNYVLMGENLGHSIRSQVAEGVSKGFGFKTPRIENAYGWVDTPDLQQWTGSIQAIQADELSNLVMRRAALEYLGRENAIKNLADAADAAGKAGATFPHVTIPSTAGVANARRAFVAEEMANREAEIGKILRDPKASAADKKTAEDRLAGLADEVKGYERYSRAALDSTDGFASHLIGHDPLGMVVRDSAKRSNYIDGRAAVNPEDKLLAIDEHARVMVDDVVSRLGGTVNPDTRRIDFPPEVRPLIEKVAEGKRVTANDLKDIRQHTPEGAIAELFVADVGKTPSVIANRMTQMLGKAYSLTVSGPLAALASHPVFLAHRRIAYDTMLPVFEELQKAGLSTKTSAYMLESAANKRALNLTFNATDNVGEHSVFSELTDNFLMFQRAQEDFLKRMFRATSANPALLARANTLVSVAHHAGIVSVQKIQSDDGTDENQLMFVYPGSAALTRMIGDGWASLGGDRDALNMLPQFKGFSSQLRFINPSVSNPLQFSANPIIGLPLHAVRAMFPETSNMANEWLTLLNGGERYFAEQTVWDSILPSALSRIVPMVFQNEKDSQYASALRSALTYAEAAGVLAEPGKASPDEVQKSQDTIRSMVQNIMIQRAVFGMIAPGAPQLTEPGDMKTNASAMAQGITNIKSEWFQVLEDQSKLYPDDSGRALSEAHVEWARRYPAGSSIANPKAFTVGSTQMAGSDAKAPATTEATQWMMDNLDWVKNNRAIAFQLLPAASGKWYEAAPYRLQVRQELREHKDLKEFYRDTALSDELSTFYDTSKQLKQAKLINPDMAAQLDTQFQAWEMQWKRLHPGAATELARKSDPNVAHEEVAPAIRRSAEDPNLPAELKPLQPALKEMYADYTTYRDLYSAAPRSGRGALNKEYRTYGDRRWTGTPLEKVWKDLGKYESS